VSAACRVAMACPSLHRSFYLALSSAAALKVTLALSRCRPPGGPADPPLLRDPRLGDQLGGLEVTAAQSVHAVRVLRA
jgi:hypothetical protein